MATHRALIASGYNAPLTIQNVPKPTAAAGEVVVRILATMVLPYMSEVLSGARQYPLSFPLTPGGGAIGRIEAAGADAVALAPGQLVFCESFVRARDDAGVTILLGFHNGGHAAAQKLAAGPWRHGSYAEFARFPLENAYALDEARLLGGPAGGGLGYAPADLLLLPTLLVGYGSCAEIAVQPGDAVVVAPATGTFGGAAVAVALSLGAVVVAAGRSREGLDALAAIWGRTGRLRTVVLRGDKDADSVALKGACPDPAKGADAYIDFSPPAAAGTSHIAAAIGALRVGGRCCLAGGILGEAPIPYIEVMHKCLKIHGRFMYDPPHVRQMIKMVEAGVLRLGLEGAGVKTLGEFGLEQVEEAMELANKNYGWGKQVVLVP